MKFHQCRPCLLCPLHFEKKFDLKVKKGTVLTIFIVLEKSFKINHPISSIADAQLLLLSDSFVLIEAKLCIVSSCIFEQ